MDGNRGAKGSIKDRLISMLYRLRYKKRTLKEENYTVDKKNKQENYLYTLKKFGEKENIDLLPKEDKKELDKINFKVNFKVVKKAGIEDDIDFKLDSIESKNSELDEKVDLKQEIRKTKKSTISSTN